MSAAIRALPGYVEKGFEDDGELSIKLYRVLPDGTRDPEPVTPHQDPTVIQPEE